MGQEKNVEALHFNKAVLHVTSILSATYTLKKDELVVRVVATSDDEGTHINIILQPADQMFGKIITVAVATIATENVVIKLPDYAASTIATLTATGDDAILYSDGVEWRVIGGTQT